MYHAFFFFKSVNLLTGVCGVADLWLTCKRFAVTLHGAYTLPFLSGKICEGSFLIVF